MYTVARVSPCGRGERRTRRDGERTVGEGVDLRVLAPVAVDPAEARQRVLAVDVHGARAADTLTAGPTERQCRVQFVLDLDERIEDLLLQVAMVAEECVGREEEGEGLERQGRDGKEADWD